MELLEECPADTRCQSFAAGKEVAKKQHEVSAACQEICDSHSLKKLGFDFLCFLCEIWRYQNSLDELGSVFEAP